MTDQDAELYYGKMLDYFGENQPQVDIINNPKGE